jgi:5-formyltetrahydrofolate cyclo-ligase
MASKATVRAGLLARRSAIPPGPRGAADSALVTYAMGTAVSMRAATVAGYVPLPGEPAGPGLVDALAAVAGRVLLPVLRDDRDLDWAAFTGPDCLVAGPLGLRQPSGPRLGVAAITSADLMIVPAVAVDRTGLRLGRGGGSYDRALARVTRGRPLVVALLYDGEVIDSVPADPHDLPVDAVITPSGGLFRFSTNVDQDTKTGRPAV